ncbi:helix-turn-helix domain-containing protein [Robertmurraya sp. DFI.2.37]|uniref:helix-turn-helix domain-containing protein n=1 Tax=Robertmurraya sp. DFI.2.37 TaxID=3031819 RepID=UPI00124827DB|nr:helix-turn-helix domain-containing protein [Robertmurraya sp. DFI.2.37]MDF1507645.1 helix-turn-helix domain-containing protein [Robertmurraya sp. DFI.2.37]
MQKNYFAIIPANVRYDKDLTPNAKLLYGEITALCNEKGFCWATNNYFSELYGVSKKSISKWINQLIQKGYVSSEIQFKEGSKEIFHRYLRIVPYPTEEKFHTPMEEKVKDNNTVINNTLNNTKEYKPSRRKQVYDKDSIHYQLALRLFENILANNPDFKKPNLQNWANDVRLMIERDNRTEKQISYLMDWVQNDSFWKSNILSVSKLRDKFDQLAMRAKEESVKRSKPVENHVPRAYQSLQDWACEDEPQRDY